MMCMKCGTMLTVKERWCRACGAPQDHRGEEAPENVAEYRRMVEELMRDGGLAEWQEVELQRLRRRMGVGDGTHRKLLKELEQAHAIPVEVFVDARPLGTLKIDMPAFARFRVLNVGETALFVQAAYGLGAGKGIQMTAAVLPLEEMEGTELSLEFTPEEYGHHHLEVMLSISETEGGPFRPLQLTPTRLQVGRQSQAGAPVIDLGQGEIRECEWIEEDSQDDWRALRLEWADASALTAFQERFRARKPGAVEASIPLGSVDNAATLSAQRQARAQAARMESQRTTDLQRAQQEQADEAYQKGQRGRMEAWVQAESWGRQERETVRREERLAGLIRWAETQGIRFKDIPRPVSEEWLQWAERQVMEKIQKP